MSIIIAEKIHHNYALRHVLRDVSLTISPNDRFGLIGPNGEGKTTLLRIIAGELDPTEGAVHRRRGLRVGYLPQVLPELKQTTIRGAMLDVLAPLLEMEKQLHELADRLAGDHSPDLLDRYGQLQAEFEARGGHSYPNRIEQVLTGLGFPPAMWERPLAELSGGQRTRAYLGTLLLEEPDLLMLDEPTNHLDLEAVEWLEYWLRSFNGALLVVSHDRYFLDRVTADTLEVAFGDVEKYRGSYSAYLTQRAERYKERMRRWEAQQDYIRETRDFIAKHLAGQRTKEAQGRRTRLERFIRDEAIQRPAEHQSISLTLNSSGRTGNMVFRATELTIGYSSDAPLVHSDKLEVLRGQRVAIVGPNGSGKTTLLRTMLGQLDPLGGGVKLGSGVKVGYLSQTHSELDQATSVIEAVQSAVSGCTEQQARDLLARMLIQGDDVFKKVTQLSGGQRSRVLLARLMLQEPNVLALDEPTNHLDIPSREIIEELLQSFEGTVIMVSHDRFLIDAVASDVWVVDGGAVHEIAGGWEAYVAWRSSAGEEPMADSARAAHGIIAGGAPASEDDDANGASAAKQQRQQERQDRKSEYKAARKQANLVQRLQSRHEALEAEIEQVEAELELLSRQISQAGEDCDLNRVSELGRQYETANARLKKMWDEWAELGEQLT